MRQVRIGGFGPQVGADVSEYSQARLIVLNSFVELVSRESKTTEGSFETPGGLGEVVTPGHLEAPRGQDLSAISLNLHEEFGEPCIGFNHGSGQPKLSSPRCSTAGH